MRVLTLRPSAKINLTLRVGPRRADGYHEVRTLMQSIALHDTVVVSERRGQFRLQCRTPGVPEDQTNLAWRAATVLWEALGKTGEPRDAHIRIDKAIPAQAGLGGGSANAAAALVGLHTLWGGKLSRRHLLRLGAQLGSDVPFFLQGGTAVATGRGEELYPVDDVQRLGVVVIKPSFGVSTADAYRWLDEDRAAGLEAAEPTGEAAGREVDLGWPSGGVGLANDLAAPVARRHPEIQSMVDACLAEGAYGAQMSGSGSAVFGLFSEAAATRAVKRLRRPEWLVILTRTQRRRDAAL
ncbi:MAG: 4-(cytidine 5'-diphospho)-2-C-methyl-D-erythritol kinase [Vicinamibacterales bacterium]|jgi:4-diphosphocytidyl-2-C-methyl-D-erythritol kinase